MQAPTAIGHETGPALYRLKRVADRRHLALAIASSLLRPSSNNRWSVVSPSLSPITRTVTGSFKSFFLMSLPSASSSSSDIIGNTSQAG